LPWYIYIIECSDSKLYTGITNNLELRVRVHNSGKGGRFTRCRIPVKLLYSEKSSGKSEALIREAGIKRLSRQEKLELIGKG